MFRSLSCLLCVIAAPALGAGNSGYTDTSPPPEGLYNSFHFPFDVHNVTWEEVGRDPHRLYPIRGEEGDFTGIRFETGWTSTHVQEIRYFAPKVNYGGVNCVINLPRKVDLYVISGDAPGPSDVPVDSFVVPGSAAAGTGSVEFVVDVSPTVSVPAGSALFVAIEMPGSWPNVSCLTTGPDMPDAAGQDEEWWNFGNAWVSMESLGIDTKPIASIHGWASL